MYGNCLKPVLCLLAGVSSFFAQEQKPNPVTITSAPSEVKNMLRLSTDQELIVKSKVVFTPTQGNSDDTLTGNLVYEISKDNRHLIAQSTNQSLADIPEKVVIKNVIASFEKHARCPELRFEFMPIKIKIAGLEGQSERFKLIFPETEQELSKLLCVWAKKIGDGRGNYRDVIARFNKTLSGEKDDQ